MLVPSNQNQGGCCGTAETYSKMLKGHTKCKNTSNVVYSELTCQLFALTMHYDFCRNPNRSIPRSPSIVGGHQIEMGSKAAESNKNGKPGLEADASGKPNTSTFWDANSNWDFQKPAQNDLQKLQTTGSWESDFVETFDTNARS